MDKLVLIDGHSILNRAFYGVPDLTNSEGLNTNAVYWRLPLTLRNRHSVIKCMTLIKAQGNPCRRSFISR